jgi:hypothetical protein|tara:strand:+ start:151 stop:333 length:183 start_codon:yes stop_codon:yes gene_type:complete
MTHKDDWEYIKTTTTNNLPYKDIIKELYNMLEDNKDIYNDDNDKRSLLLQAVYNKVSKCL